MAIVSHLLLSVRAYLKGGRRILKGNKKRKKNEMTENEITIRFTRNESLVLFVLLRRIDAQEDLDIFEDQAEERV